MKWPFIHPWNNFFKGWFTWKNCLPLVFICRAESKPKTPCVKTNLCSDGKLSAMFFVPPIVYLRVGGQTTVAGWMGWVKIWQFLEGYGMRVRCAFCFLDLVKWALAIGISATRKKTRTMTRSLVVLSVIFILTKCRWEDDVLNFFRTCKQKMRRSESQGPKSRKVFSRGRVTVGVGD